MTPTQTIIASCVAAVAIIATGLKVRAFVMTPDPYGVKIVESKRINQQEKSL